MMKEAMSRRRFLRTAAMGLGASILAACAPAATAPTAQPTSAGAKVEPTTAPPATAAATQAAATQPAAATAAPASGQPVKLRLVHWAGNVELDALKKMYAVYQPKNPNVSIEWIDASGGTWGIEKMMTMIAGGDAPDILMLNTGAFETFAASNILLPLEPMVEAAKLDLNIYIPTALDAVRFNGKLYGLPKAAPDMVLYYNKDMFDKAKLAYPTADWTWNDLLAAAEKLTVDTNGDGKMEQWGWTTSPQGWPAWIFIYSNGGRILSDDFKQALVTEPAAVEGAKFYFDKLAKFSPPPGALPELAWFGSWYQQQKVAMATFAGWYLQQLMALEKKFAWDIAPLPKSPTGKRAFTAPLDMWGIYAQTKVAPTAFDFVRFLTGKEGMQTYADLGGQYSPPAKDVLASDKWLHRGGVNGQIFVDSMQYSQKSPQAFAKGAQVNSIWSQEVTLIIAGQQNTEQAMRKINDRLTNEVLK